MSAELEYCIWKSSSIKNFNPQGQIMELFNPFQPNVGFHVETSQLFCSANQMTGFNMKCSTGLNWVKQYHAQKGATEILQYYLALPSRFEKSTNKDKTKLVPSHFSNKQPIKPPEEL